jgi:excisionase family DNA binding protein
MEPIQRMVVTVPEMAIMLGIGRNSAYEAVKTGQVKSVRIGGRVLIARHEIDRILGASTEAAPAAA